MKKVKDFNSFIGERKYDFSHPDTQDKWEVTIPEDKPQKYDKVICTNNTGYEDVLTLDKEYQIIGISSMGDKYFITDNTNKHNYYPTKCFISEEKVSKTS